MDARTGDPRTGPRQRAEAGLPGGSRGDLLSYASPSDPLSWRLVIGALERLGGRRRLLALYETHRAGLAADPWGHSLRVLDVGVDCPVAERARIPPRGPLLAIANHPFGTLDGMVLAHLIEQVRSDVLVVANDVLHRIPELRQRVLPIGFGADFETGRRNVRTRRAAREHLRRGGALVVFPAGGVATAPGGLGPAVDLPWRRFTADLIEAVPAPVLPVFFPGQNGRLFQLASQVAPPLRLGLLVRELNAHRGRPVTLRIGEPLAPEALASSDRDTLAELRARVYELGGGEPLVRTHRLRSYLLAEEHRGARRRRRRSIGTSRRA